MARKQVVFDKFEQAQPGTLTPDQYDEFVRDTVNFLDYIAEPMKLKRQSLGILVMVFLLVFRAVCLSPEAGDLEGRQVRTYSLPVGAPAAAGTC